MPAYLFYFDFLSFLGFLKIISRRRRTQRPYPPRLQLPLLLLSQPPKSQRRSLPRRKSKHPLRKNLSPLLSKLLKSPSLPRKLPRKSLRPSHPSRRLRMLESRPRCPERRSKLPSLRRSCLPLRSTQIELRTQIRRVGRWRLLSQHPRSPLKTSNLLWLTKNPQRRAALPRTSALSNLMS